MRKRRKIRTRSNLVKRIVSAASTGEALEIAARGRALLPIERMVENYLRPSGGLLGRRLRANLIEALLKAVNARDWVCLQAATDAVKHFGRTSQKQDSLRANILAMKGVLDDCGQSMEIARLAECLDLSDSPGDGFSRLRETCKELHFPIKEGKRGRKQLSPK